MNSWIIESWRDLIPFPWSHIFLALVAVLCGGIIGSERERHEKPAGMRTIMLVALGACIFTMVSFVFTTSTGDSGRVAAQIVTGIGFLGAGIIMRDRGTIRGTTTAATIWTTAAIGTVVGSGHAGAGIALSLLVRLVLIGVYEWESRSLGKIRPIPVTIDFDPDHGKTRIRLERIMVDFSISRKSIAWEKTTGDGGLERLTLQLHLQAHHFCDMLDQMVSEPAVKAVGGVPEAIGD